MKIMMGVVLLTALAFRLIAQPITDTTFHPVLARPVYAKDTGPLVLIDEAHHNYHTFNGRYLPFARVLQADGYRVNGSTELFSEATLAKAKILVIANALHESNLGSWSLPTPSAFTDREIAAVVGWVEQGGSLLLIADHMPFPGAAEPLAQAFGFRFYNGFAQNKKSGNRDVFTRGHGLAENVITNGRNVSEKILSVRTFMGQGFAIPEGAVPLLTLENYTIRLPETAWQFKKDTPSLPGAGLAQGAYLSFGKGRIVVFGEAAMFTAQRDGRNKIGINGPEGAENVQLLCNVIHWLDGVIK